MKLKRLLSLILTLAMLLSVVPTAFAAGDTVATGSCGENVAWTLDSEGTLTISGEGAMVDYDWNYGVLPEWLNYGVNISKLVIEEGVTYIGRDSFSGLGIEAHASIESVSIADSVTAIGENAFAYCQSLGEIDIPEGITAIERCAFYACSLKAVDIPESVTSIGPYAFGQCHLTSLEIPAGVVSIGDSAFEANFNLEVIYFRSAAAPEMGENVFGDVMQAVAYYPEGHESWDEVTANDYGGTLTWVGYTEDGAHSHSYTEIVTAPTCTEQGYTTFVCACGDSYKDVYTQAVGHNWEHGAIEIKCTVCGESIGGILDDVLPGVSCSQHEFVGGECTVCGYSVLFDGWLAPDFAEGDYSFVAIPDTQGMVDLWPNEYYKQMKWIADNKDELNIQAVFHMGDMVESNSEGYWSIAKMGTDYLDRAGIVWMPMRGNHDDSEFFNKYYGHFSGKSWFVDSLEDDKLDVCAWSFTAGGRDYMVLNLGWAPTVVELDWATELAANNPQKNIIVLCHAYMNGDNSLLDWDTDLTPELKEQFIAKLPSGIPFETAIKVIPDGEAIWAAFKEYENVVLAMSGHVHSENIGVFTDNNAAGRPVSSLLIDRQEDDDTEHLGMLAVLSFSEDTDEVQVHWYSTRYDAFYGEKSSFAITVPHLSGETEESHVHQYVPGTVTEATCTKAGFTTYVCSCGASYDDGFTSALGHSWDEGVITKEPTESAEGEKTSTCTRCGKTRTERVPSLSHEHSYSQTVTAPGCTEKGYTTHKCVCGDSYKDNYTDALGHNWDGGVVTKEPTEGAEGEKTFTCLVCGETEVRAIASSSAHTHSYTVGSVTEATCTKAGFTTFVCSCGASYDDGFTNALGHSWDEGVITKEPTESAEGEKLFTCTRCEKTRTESVPKLEHTHKHEAAVTAPTCTEQGFTTHSCPCGDSYTDSFTEALGHSWDEGKVTKEPTTEAEGEMTYTCTVCSETRTEAMEKLPPDCGGKHSWDKGSVTKEPTKDSKGEMLYTCTVCGETKTEDLAKLPSADDFKDVRRSDYFYESVEWALDEGVTAGVGADTFGPTQACTRAQVVTFLWRAAGEPAPRSENNPFTDVQKGQYYYKAVLWAVEQGITDGVSATSFAPNMSCTRAQVVTFLWRAAGEPKPRRDSSDFTDVKNGDYYASPVFWAVENKITSGLSEDSFGPDATCTRAQVVTFLYRAFR